jgi:hypothetical protein
LEGHCGVVCYRRERPREWSLKRRNGVGGA